MDRSHRCAWTTGVKAKLPPARPRPRRPVLALPTRAPLPVEESIRQIEVELPMPPAELSPNARVHRMVRARAVKRYRQFAAEAAALDRLAYGMRGRWRKALVHVAVYCSRPDLRDQDNLVASLKAALDGLADAGVVANDRDLVLGQVELFAATERQYVRLTLEATE